MRGIEQHPHAVHFFQQLAPVGTQSADAAGSVAILVRAVVCGTDDAETPVEPLLNLGGFLDRRGSFHAEDEPDRRVGGHVIRLGGDGRLPAVVLTLQRLLVRNLDHHPLPHQRPVVGQLPEGHRMGRLARLVERQLLLLAMQPGQQRRDTQPDASLVHLGERDGAVSGDDLREVLLELANLLARQFQIAVPLQAVPGQVEVGVEDQHGWLRGRVDG